MLQTKQAICRSCNNFCHMDITLEDGRPIKAAGDRLAPVFEGFCCPKGRALPQMHTDPDRLLTSLKRMDDGSYAAISSEQAIDEIAAKLKQIIDRDGPEAVACYLGSGTYEQQAGAAMIPAFLKAIGSPMLFTATSIDQPGRRIARALHGSWAGGRPRPETWETFLLVGGNPVISKQYFSQGPGRLLKRHFRGQAKLIVVDPRRTETARNAHVHLQIRPGEDATLIAGLIHLVIAAGMVATDFVTQNARGLQTLTRAVKPFTPDYVARRCGIAEEDLREAATIIGTSRQGDCVTGTGATMAPRGNLTCYLVNCLQTLRGFWPREGDEVCKPPVLTPPREYRAQPVAPAPAWGFGRTFRTRSLQESAAGLPLGALPDEILTPGPEQIRAVFMHGGAMRSWPDQARTLKALRNLELLVVPDVEFSATARVATHVIGVKKQLEMPAMSHFVEMLGQAHSGYGWDDPYASWSPALIDPPADADVVEVWQLYYEVARRLGLALEIGNAGGDTVPLDMSGGITTEDMYDAICVGSRIPLAEVRKHPHGHVFDEARTFVGAREEACDARLELADPHMIAELETVAAENPQERIGVDEQFPLLMIPRRMQNVTNGTHEYMRTSKMRNTSNPAFMHPQDLAALGLEPGDTVRVASRFGEIHGLVAADRDLRQGVVSMTHCFGRNPDEEHDPLGYAANTNRLLRMDFDADPYTSMPRMSAMPVSVTKAAKETAS